MKAQGATEYLVLMSVVLLIALVCIAILVWPTGSSKDVKQSQKDINLGIGKIAYPELAQGLITYYKFDEGVGDTAYNSAGQNVYYGTLMNNTGWASGIRGKAASFDGSNDCIDIADASSLSFESSAQDFSIFAWVKSTDAVAPIVDNRNPSGYILYWSSGAPRFILGSASVAGATDIADGNWHSVGVAVHRTGNAQIYVDGRPDGNPVSVSGQTMTTKTNVYISTNYGCGGVGADFLSGTLDELRIYNRALSASEIELLYKNPGYP